MNKRVFAIAALVLAPTLAWAQPRHIHPVPAPSALVDENGGKAVEEEAGPGPLTFWTWDLVNNKHAAYGAMLFNFVVLLLIYWRFGKQPVAEGLKNRKHAIAAQIENAQKILREAKQRSKRYRAKLDKVADDAEKAKQAQIDTGTGEADKILRSSKEKAERLARDAEFLLEQEKKQTQIDLVRETVEKAAKEAEDLLKKNVSAADQERLAEEFLARLAADYEKGLPLGGAS
jgi:F-type H+-transporting ATPase subunit b